MAATDKTIVSVHGPGRFVVVAGASRRAALSPERSRRAGGPCALVHLSQLALPAPRLPPAPLWRGGLALRVHAAAARAALPVSACSRCLQFGFGVFATGNPSGGAAYKVTSTCTSLGHQRTMLNQWNKCV